VSSAGRPNVEGTFANLLNGRDASQRQEESEMVGKVLKGAGDCIAAYEVFGLEGVTVGRQNELSLALCSRRTRFERGQSFRHRAGCGDGDMYVVGLEGAAEVRFVRLALAQTLERRLLVSEGLQKSKKGTPERQRAAQPVLKSLLRSQRRSTACSCFDVASQHLNGALWPELP